MSASRHASRLQVEERRERVAGDGVHVAGREHVARRETGVAHRADDLDGHLGGVDAVRPRERVPLRVGAVRRRGAEGLAFQVLRRGHAQRLAADDRERRLVVNHHDGGGEEVGVAVPELDERVDVRGTQVPVAAVRHPRDRLPRAHSDVHGDVEAGLGVPAAVERHQERRGRPLPLPVVPEPDARRRRGGPGAQKRRQHPKWQAHGLLRAVRAVTVILMWHFATAKRPERATECRRVSRVCHTGSPNGRVRPIMRSIGTSQDAGHGLRSASPGRPAASRTVAARTAAGRSGGCTRRWTSGRRWHRHQPSQRTPALDERHRELDDLPVGNLMRALVGLESSKTPARVPETTATMSELLAGTGRGGHGAGPCVRRVDTTACVAGGSFRQGDRPR